MVAVVSAGQGRLFQGKFKTKKPVANDCEHTLDSIRQNEAKTFF